jgi:hypothetical protein
MRFLKARRTATVAVVAVAMILAGAGIAVAATTTSGGTAVSRVRVLTEDAATIWTGSTYTNLGTLTIYAGAGSMLLASFSAEVACYGGSGWCNVRILIDGAEAAPVVGTDFAFDSTDGGTETFGSWESHAMQRTRIAGSTITHTVTVQVAQVGTGVTARYDDWTLSVMAVAP